MSSIQNHSTAPLQKLLHIINYPHIISFTVLLAPDPMEVAASVATHRTTYLCKHCNCELLKKAYERHRRLYLNEQTNQWILNSDHDDGDSEELFSSNSDSEIDCEDDNSYVPPPPPIVTFDEATTMEFDPPPDMHGA